MTATETALQALQTAINAVSALPDIRRNVALDDALEEIAGDEQSGRLLIMRDGETLIVDQFLGDGDATRFNLAHRAEIEWIVAGNDEDDRESLFDAGLEAIATAVETTPALHVPGAFEARLADAPEYGLEPCGARTAKTVRLLVTLLFVSTRPF